MGETFEAGWAGPWPPEPGSTYGRARDGPSARWLGGRRDRPRAREEPRRELVPDGNRNVTGGRETYPAESLYQVRDELFQSSIRSSRRLGVLICCILICSSSSAFC